MNTRLSRRSLLLCGLLTLGGSVVRAQTPETHSIYLPMVIHSPLPGTLLGPATGTVEAAIAWLVPAVRHTLLTMSVLLSMAMPELGKLPV